MSALSFGGGRRDEPRPLGVQRSPLRAGVVLGARGLPRSSFHERHRRLPGAAAPCSPEADDRYDDEEFLAWTRRTIQESTFHGEGHREVRAGPRLPCPPA